MSPGEKVRKSYSSGLCSETEVTSLALVIVLYSLINYGQGRLLLQLTGWRQK